MEKHIPISGQNNYSLLNMIFNRRIRAETFAYFDSKYQETEDEAEIFREISSRRKRGGTNMEENKILEMLAQLNQGQTELMLELKHVLKQDIQEVKNIQLRMEAKFTEKFDSLCETDVMYEEMRKERERKD